MSLRFESTVRKSPAIIYLFFIIIGIVSIRFFPVKVCFLLYTLLFLFIIILLFYILNLRLSSLIIDILLIPTLIVAVMFTSGLRENFPIKEWMEKGNMEHLGMLLEVPVMEGKNKVFNVRLINSLNRSFSPSIIRVYARTLEQDIGYGDIILFRGILEKPAVARNPGGFNYRTFLKRKGVQYISYIKNGAITYIGHSRVNPFLKSVIFPLREYCTKVISKNLDDIHSSLLQGLMVGQRGNIPREVKDIFSDAGVIHILAVSGLHVGIISLFLFVVFRCFRLPFSISIFLSCFLLILYAFLTNLRPSVVRATIMFVFIMFGMLSQRRVIIINIIALSAILILILKPEDLFDVGFQLSYAATFSIVILSQRIYDCFPLRLKGLRVLRNFIILPFSVSLAAQLGTAPIIAFYFYKLPIIAPIANIAIVPIVSLVIPIGFLTVLANIIHPIFSAILSGANWLLLHLMLKLSIFFSNIPYLLLWLKRPTPLFFVFYYPLLFTFFLLHAQKRFKFFIFTSLVIANIFIFGKVWNISHRELKVDFLDVSQGDASIIEFPNSEICIVDGGRRSDYVDYGEKVLTPFLRSKGIKRINTIIATHPDVDHYGGLITVLENFKVDKLFLNGSSKMTFLYRKMLDTAKERGVPIYNIHKSETIWLGDYPLYVLNPPVLKGFVLPSNEGSIVFKFGYGAQTFLFTGDFSNKILKLPSILMASTVLKFPHHGARFGDERRFLSNVHPEITSISVGKDNPYGHPTKENIAILDSLKSRIYRTDRDGAIILKTDGKEIWVKTMIK